VTQFEEALKKRFSPKSLDGVSVSPEGMNSDIHAGADYRAHLVGVLARRAVAEAVARGGASDASDSPPHPAPRPMPM
jgi:carbon-monoxide dehydrogenase medium subunit